MSDEFEEAQLDGPREGETPASFQARLDLLERLRPALEEFSAHAVDVSVESPRRIESRSGIHSDYTFQLNDIRIRVVVCPGNSLPIRDQALMHNLSLFLLEVADTDAVAVVADDDQLSTWILDVYQLHLGNDGLEEEGKPVKAAFREYFRTSLYAIDLPDFRDIFQAPTSDDLLTVMRSSIRNAFARIAESAARIPEKKAALESLGPNDLSEVESLVAESLRRKTPPDLDSLMNTEQAES